MDDQAPEIDSGDPSERPQGLTSRHSPSYPRGPGDRPLPYRRGPVEVPALPTLRPGRTSRPALVYGWLVAAFAWILGRTRTDRLIMSGVGAALLVTGLTLALTDNGRGAAIIPPTPPSPAVTYPTSAAPLHLSFGAAAPVAKAPAAPATCPAATSPKASPTGTAPSGTSSTAPAAASSAAASAPQRICIPAIGVTASVITLGLNSDHTVQVPALSQVRDAGWYKYSPAPGLNGPTIILGHIDSATFGKGVFFDLGKLHAGDLVNVSRADGSVASFRVDTVAEYPKTAFPTAKVYGDTPDPTIRLITCGGRFDSSTRSYLDNIVAYGSLVSVG